MHTIAGTKEAQAASIQEERWAGTMESIRKDSERYFGIMKKRFRILRIQSLLLTASSIDTVFKVSANVVVPSCIYVAFCFSL